MRVALACVLLEAGVNPFPARQAGTGPGVLEEIVVMVNGDVVTKTDIDERLRVTRGSRADPAEARSDAVEPDMLTRVLRDAIDERLMTQRAAELGLAVRDEDVDRVLAAVRAESGVQDSETFNNLMEREGMSLVTLRANTRRQLLIEQVRQHLFARIAVTNEEAMRHYNTHRAEMARATVTFREVRMAVPRPGHAPDSVRDRALVKVVKVGELLARGVDFEQVAQEFSDGTLKRSGRPIGPVAPGDLEPSVRAALQGLRPGGISAPVETSDGYSFLKLESAKAPAAPTFHENRGQIVDTLLGSKQRAALEDLLERLRGSAILRWKRRDLQAAYERPAPYR
jgi:peptidyl-prolyl cis-trans isomerase SurA